jgi:hypothetical protein
MKLKKEIDDDTRRWKDLPYSWIGRINILKLATLWKIIYRFNAIPTKIPMSFSQLYKKQCKIHIERLQIGKEILSKRINAGVNI